MIQSIFIIQTGFKRDPNVIQTWSKRDSTWFKRDINVIQTRIVIQTLLKNNVDLIDLSRGVSLKRSLRLVVNQAIVAIIQLFIWIKPNILGNFQTL